VCHDVDDGAFDDAGFVVSDGLEVIWVDCLFDLLHEGAFEEVAFFESLGGRVVAVFFNGNLILVTLSVMLRAPGWPGRVNEYALFDTVLA
jgi:hypothetical protein